MKTLRHILWLTVGVLMVACQSPYQTDEGFIFGTVYRVTYQYHSDLQDDIVEVLNKVDGEFSMFNERSTVARINRGEEVTTSAMYDEVFKLAVEINQDTQGAFDVTVAPLVNAWGFGFKNELMPTREQVDSLLKIRNQYDFSAIAKGYGCDAVAALLSSKGIRNFMIEIGGEVVVSGQNPKQGLWRIGVTKPTDDSLNISNEMQAVLAVTDQAMATSGNYHNFYYKDGQKYAHTIDPRTGYPVQHSILSATVFSESCAKADAYATAFMVMGLDEARRLLERHADLKAYLIYTDEAGEYAVWQSDSLNIE